MNVSIESRDNQIQWCGTKFVANTDLWSVQLRDVLHVPCVLCFADNSDDVHDGVRQRWRKNDDSGLSKAISERNPCAAIQCQRSCGSVSAPHPQSGHKNCVVRLSLPDFQEAGLSLKRTH